MPCQELSSSLSQSNNPAGALAQQTNPGTDGFCRSYNFTQPDYYITLVDSFPIVTFGGLRIQTLPQDG
jgi:hypothetical protein